MQQFFIFLTHTLETSCEDFSKFFFFSGFQPHLLVVQANDFFFSDGLNKFKHDFVETYSASKLVSETRPTSLKNCSFFGRRCFGLTLLSAVRFFRIMVR